MCKCVCSSHLFLFLTTAAVQVQDFVLCEVFVAWHSIPWMQCFCHCLKAIPLNSLGGHRVFTYVHSSAMLHPSTVGLFFSLWRWLLSDSDNDASFVFSSFSFFQIQGMFSYNPTYWWTYICTTVSLHVPSSPFNNKTNDFFWVKKQKQKHASYWADAVNCADAHNIPWYILFFQTKAKPKAILWCLPVLQYCLELHPYWPFPPLTI